MPIDELSPDKVVGPDNQNKSPDGHEINLPGNLFPKGDAASQECEGMPEIMVGACHASSRVQRNHRGKKRSTLRASTRLIQLVLGGVIGLAAGGFILSLINPEHPLLESISNMIHGEQAAEPFDQSQSKIDLPDPVENTPSLVGKITSDPITPKPVPSELPFEQTELASAPPVAPQATANDQDDERIADSEPVVPLQEHKTLVLDFSKPRIRAVLSSVNEKSDVAIKITNIVGLNTPYELKSQQEVVSRGHPVDIVFPEYADTRMRVTIRSKQGKSIVEVTPELLLTQNKWVDLTQDRLKGLFNVWRKKKQNAEFKLGQAENLVDMLGQSLKSAKGQVASAQRKQLALLRKNAIPQLKKQIKAIEKQIAVLQHLSQFVEQIDSKAELHYVVQP